MRTTHEPTPPRRQRGFTLIEIMAVVLIIGLLSTLVGLAIFPQIDKSRVNAAKAQLLCSALAAQLPMSASTPSPPGAPSAPQDQMS